MDLTRICHLSLLSLPHGKTFCGEDTAKRWHGTSHTATDTSLLYMTRSITFVHA